VDPSDRTVNEVAKAAAEAAKFGTQTVKTTEKILRFTSKVFRTPIEEASGIIGDRLRLYRWERQVAYVDKVNELLESKGITDSRPVTPKFALPILENASLEDDDFIQSIWAKLMVSAMDTDNEVEIRYAFIEIIKTLTPLDARILDKLFNLLAANPDTDWNNVQAYSIKKEDLCGLLNIDGRDYEVSVFNLFRSQCLAPAVIENIGIIANGEHPTSYKGSKAVTMTPLGVDFVKICLQP